MTERFIPRQISPESAAQGFNNEGRGKMMGYECRLDAHEKTCRYRITCKGDENNPDREMCTCRAGLWKEDPVPKPVVAKKTKPKAKAKLKSKAKVKSVKKKKRRR